MVTGLRQRRAATIDDSPIVKTCAIDPARSYGEFPRFLECGQSLEDAVVHADRTRIKIIASPAYWLLRLAETEALSVSAVSPRCYFYSRTPFNQLKRTECYVREGKIRSVDGDFCLKTLSDADVAAYETLRVGEKVELVPKAATQRHYSWN
ncbi:MAG: hypothetical protein AAFY57_14865 [Cyanobacteria bacterium J06642_2]